MTVVFKDMVVITITVVVMLSVVVTVTGVKGGSQGNRSRHIIGSSHCMISI